jgi:ATP-dependent protease ClpP protease subunit
MTVRRQTFYQIATKDRTADIMIYGDITSMATALRRWYGDDENVAEVDSFQITKEINGLDVDTINVFINSYGGEVAEALAIYSALKRHSASVHTYCDGFACSAATIIFCAGDVRTMGSIALLMIHNCMSYIGYANSEEMRKAAEDNDKINQSSINAYLTVTSLSEEKITELMDNATWLTAKEALDYGFATEIADQEEDGTAQQSAFGMIREAVLTTQGRTAGPVVDLNEVMQKLAELGTKIDALQKPEVPDPEEDPEENVPENTARARAVRFFSFLTKED